MKHKFYNDGNTAGLLVLSGRGLYHYTSSFEEGLFYTTDNSPTAHLTPVPFIQYTPWMIIYNVPDSNGLAGEQMDLQVYTNPYIQDQWKGRVIAIT